MFFFLFSFIGQIIVECQFIINDTNKIYILIDYFNCTEFRGIIGLHKGLIYNYTHPKVLCQSPRIEIQSWTSAEQVLLNISPEPAGDRRKSHVMPMMLHDLQVCENVMEWLKLSPRVKNKACFQLFPECNSGHLTSSSCWPSLQTVSPWEFPNHFLRMTPTPPTMIW